MYFTGLILGAILPPRNVGELDISVFCYGVYLLRRSVRVSGHFSRGTFSPVPKMENSSYIACASSFKLPYMFSYDVTDDQ
jgi:hypothetical protein